jgi:hypothetical protein
MTFRVFILFMRGEEEGRDASFCALGFGLLRMGLGLRIGVRGVGGSNITWFKSGGIPNGEEGGIEKTRFDASSILIYLFHPIHLHTHKQTNKQTDWPFSFWHAAQPHTSVSDSSLYKHIDCDLLESARARQLLIWCSGRALSSSSTSSPSTQNSKTKDKDQGKGKGKEELLPPLTDDQKSLLRGVQEDLIKMLVDKKIDTNVISHDVLEGSGLGVGGKDKGKGKAGVKENEQNVRNRAREVTFNKLIEKWAFRVSFFFHIRPSRTPIYPLSFPPTRTEQKQKNLPG